MPSNIFSDVDEDDQDIDDEEPEGDEPEEDEEAPTGDLEMEEILTDLMGALGVHLPKNLPPEQFKRQLYEAVMTKVRELTGQGAGAKAGDIGKGTPNPLMTGEDTDNNPLLQQEAQPMFFSTDGVALSLLDKEIGHRAQQARHAATVARRREQLVAVARGKRTAQVNRILAAYPDARAEVEAVLNGADAGSGGMAFSVDDSSGTVRDAALDHLQALEQELARRFPTEAAHARQRLDERVRSRPDLDDAAEALSRYMK